MSKSDSCDDKMNIEEILHSLDNDRNLSISKLTYDKINNMKYNMLERLGMNDDELESFMDKFGFEPEEQTLKIQQFCLGFQ